MAARQVNKQRLTKLKNEVVEETMNIVNDVKVKILKRKSARLTRQLVEQLELVV